jgi:hypothetical protein
MLARGGDKFGEPGERVGAVMVAPGQPRGEIDPIKEMKRAETLLRAERLIGIIGGGRGVFGGHGKSLTQIDWGETQE